MLDKSPTQHPSLVAVHRARSPKSGLQLGGRAKRREEYVYLGGNEAFWSPAKSSSAESYRPIDASSCSGTKYLERARTENYGIGAFLDMRKTVLPLGAV
jgi:hypothetical protein